ncbi:hypothetical protein GTY54_28590 [Streptomyces sp. SID625]|nr:hypothetical protein [Streptomyces sp. SID625]
MLFGTFAMFALGAAVNLLQGRTRGRIAFGPYMIIGALGVSICVSWSSGDGRNVTRLVSDPAPRPCRVDADDCALLGQVADLARSLDAAADDSTASVIL